MGFAKIWARVVLGIRLKSWELLLQARAFEPSEVPVLALVILVNEPSLA